MTIVMTGTHGLIGKALRASLKAKGHRVLALVRSGTPQADEVMWDFNDSKVLAEALNGADALVHLGGHNVANAIRWSASEKEKILSSRVTSTSSLVRALHVCSNPPKTFLCASAVGIYGSDCYEPVDESSNTLGNGFLAEVCQQWEAQAHKAPNHVRTVIARFGMVLSAEGGALAKMLPVFRLGLGGRIGSGKQWISWIAHPDAILALEHLLFHTDAQGPCNIVSPEPCTNAFFTKELAKAVRRPAIFPVPDALLRVALGEFAQETVLSSSRVFPRRLLETAYHFRHSTLENAFRTVLNQE